MTLKRFLLGLSLSLLGLTTTATLAANNNSASGTALVNKIIKGHASIAKQFNSISNLQGFLIKPTEAGARPIIMYADKDGKYAFIGTLVNAQGQNVTQQDFAKYIESQVADKALAAAKDTTWFVEGKKNAPHATYVIVEPNCSICHMLYEDFQPLIKSGQLQVRWILVYFRTPSSLGKAAAILTAKDKVKAWMENEKGFNMAKEEGGIKPMANVPEDIKTKLAANNDFMIKNGFNGTPVLIFKDKNGKPRVLAGLPRSNAIKQVVGSMSNKFN